MQSKYIYFILLSFTFLIVGCEPLPDTPVDDTPVVADDFNGAEIVQSIDDAPECTIDEQGRLYYIIDEEQFYYCNGLGYESIDLTGPQGEAGPGSETTGGVVVKDSAGVEFGRLLNHPGNGLRILNADGYIYTMDADAQVYQKTILFSGSGCTGTPYVNVIYEYGKSVYRDGNSKIYRPIDIGFNGITNYPSLPVNSYLNSSPAVCNESSSTTNVVELEEVTNAEVGIPPGFTPPFVFE